MENQKSSTNQVDLVGPKDGQIWCRLNIRYTNAWSHYSTYTVESQIFSDNKAIKHKYNKKVIRKCRESLEPIYSKWKTQIEADGIKCAMA